MTANDLPWLSDLCKRRYDSSYCSVDTEAWFLNRVLAGPMMFFPARTTDAFCVSMLSAVPWIANSLECNVVFICAEEGAMWQAMRLLRASIDWARLRKCTLWRVSSDTGYDLRPLALRLGATEPKPRWELRL